MVQTTNIPPPFDLQAYQPPISLWKLIHEYVPDHEREEVKNMLGESLIDQSLELHSEVDTLLEIWRDYREETTHCKPLTLPEPPGVRDRLVQEIQFFVENVRDKAKTQGVNPNKILSRHNTDILDYALESSRPDSARPSSRMLTARSTDGRETPMITSPTGSDRISAASSISEEVELMNDKLTVLKFDEVVSHLRSTLEEEIETLKKDINFLQDCLDDEATFRAQSQGTISREPSIAELKEERSTLERDLLSNMAGQTSPPLKPAMSLNSIMKPILGQTNSSKMKTSQNTALSTAKKTGPMKVFSTSSATDSGRHTHTPSAPSIPRGTSASDKLVSQKRTVINHTAVTNERPNLVLPTSPQVKTFKASEGDNLNRVRLDREVKASHEHLGLVKPTPVEAAMGPCKRMGSPSETETVVVVPSPPPSGKPTTPRPSSATRFRRMVQQCRD